MLTLKRLVWLLCVLSAGTRVFAQQAAPSSSGESRALGAGKLEAEVVTGLYSIYAYAGDALNSYSPGGSAFIGGEVGIGLTRHVAVQLGAGAARYANDMYWRPDVPHNPYFVSATLFNRWGGLRYELRGPGGVVRPYVAAGVISTRFTNITRGAKDICSTDGTCTVAAPELFDGTSVTGYVDMGINVMVRRAWGLGSGFRWYRMTGDESDPYGGVAPKLSGRSVFTHLNWHFSVLYRWH